MPKQVQPGEDIHIAPDITGKRDYNRNLIITFDLTGEQLHPNENITHKIMIFESQVNGWFLKIASSLLDEENNGFIVLMIATAYIEGIEQCRQGNYSNGKSKIFFRSGIKRIFGLEGLPDSLLDNFYSELRCGLFHNGMTGPNVRVDSRYVKPIEFLDNNLIKVNQRLFLDKIKNDFAQYLTKLRDKTETTLRKNFNKIYNFE
jgi:hypothetical protein